MPVEILPGWKTYLSILATLLLIALWTGVRYAPVAWGWTAEPWISLELYQVGLALILPGGFGAALAAMRHGVKKSEPYQSPLVRRKGDDL